MAVSHGVEPLHPGDGLKEKRNGCDLAEAVFPERLHVDSEREASLVLWDLEIQG